MIENVAAEWKELAIALGFNPPIINAIEKDNRECKDACRTMFFKWLEGEHNLEKPTWSTLIECLQRARLTSVANSLKTALQ